MRRYTYTKTFNQLTPWAETLPWDCLIRDTGCVSPTHSHSPMVNDLCAVEDCDHKLRDREVCYAVTEIPRQPGEKGESWVCWRHVRVDDGPIAVPPGEATGRPSTSTTSEEGGDV